MTMTRNGIALCGPLRVKALSGLVIVATPSAITHSAALRGLRLSPTISLKALCGPWRVKAPCGLISSPTLSS